MSMSHERSEASGPTPSRARAGVLTGAGLAVWALWVVCLIFVTTMAVEFVVDLAGAVF